MMKKKMVYFSISIFVVLLVAVFFWQYVFCVYEVEYKVEPQNLYADNNSTVVIEIVPINSFGKRIPFRKVSGEYSFIEGKDLVDTVGNYSTANKIILKAKDKDGKVSIRIKSEYSLVPSVIEIIIQKNLT